MSIIEEGVTEEEFQVKVKENIEQLFKNGELTIIDQPDHSIVHHLWKEIYTPGRLPERVFDTASQFDKDLNELAIDIYAAHQLDSHYNAEEDIREFINNHKPNVFITDDVIVDGVVKHTVTSDNPEMLGTISMTSSEPSIPKVVLEEFNNKIGNINKTNDIVKDIKRHMEQY